MDCPDCGEDWGDGPQCQTCGLDLEDLRAAAAFLDREYRFFGVVTTVRKPDGWPVLVKALRDATIGIEVAAEQTGNEKVFFPPRARGERQPIALRGYVPLKDVADLVHYIADMLEP